MLKLQEEETIVQRGIKIVLKQTQYMTKTNKSEGQLNKTGSANKKLFSGKGSLTKTDLLAIPAQE